MNTALKYQNSSDNDCYALLGSVRSLVFNEDCRNGLKRFPDGFFDLAICDIPYGINVGKMAFLTESKTTVKQKNGTKLNPRKRDSGYSLKEWDKETPGQWYFDELKRVSKEQIIFGIEYVNWQGVGTGRIKWNKGVAAGVSFKDYELAYASMINHTEELDLLWSGMMQAKSLKDPMVQQGNKKLNEKRIHPCHKPRLLYRKLIADYGFEGMKLLDTHLGGGSIRLEADLANCYFRAFEIDPEYFEKQEKRFTNFKKQLRLW
jgi:site-specific DNA-methyltransferase (adenine-specific)